MIEKDSDNDKLQGSTPEVVVEKDRKVKPAWEVNALCSYPLKLGGQKFGKVKAQFSLNFVPNFKISVWTGKELCKI